MMRDFAAIDFETANECPSSVCSVGIVVVRGGEIVDRFYSLIHPEPEYYQWFCRQVHGLGPADTEDAPVFPYVWEKIPALLWTEASQPPAPDRRRRLRLRPHQPPPCPR